MTIVVLAAKVKMEVAAMVVKVIVMDGRKGRRGTM